MPKTRIRIKCTDGKRHWWKDGWICEKCGLRREDYIEMCSVREIAIEFGYPVASTKESQREIDLITGKRINDD